MSLTYRGSKTMEVVFDKRRIHDFSYLLFAWLGQYGGFKMGVHASADDRECYRSFWPIQFHTMKSHGAVRSLERMLELSSDVEPNLNVRENPDRSELRVEIFFDSRAEAQYQDNLFQSCTRWMDHFFRFRCPSAHGDSSETIFRRRIILNFVFLPYDSSSEQPSAIAYTLWW